MISSHSLMELEDICDSFGILQDGHLVRSGDLQVSKDQICRYQIAFSNDIDKKELSAFDLLHCEKEGKVYQLVIRGNQDEVQSGLQKMNPILLDRLPVSFEEMFIYELESRGIKDE